MESTSVLSRTSHLSDRSPRQWAIQQMLLSLRDALDNMYMMECAHFRKESSTVFRWWNSKSSVFQKLGDADDREIEYKRLVSLERERDERNREACNGDSLFSERNWPALNIFQWFISPHATFLGIGHLATRQLSGALSLWACKIRYVKQKRCFHE